MNKKEAVAYAQITLDYMQSSNYKGELNPETLGIEMKQCFKLYPRNVVLSIADGQSVARKKLEQLKNGSGINEWKW